MTTARQAISPYSSATGLIIWINRTLESLWLLAVVAVPVAFFHQDYVFSEAVIAYVEVPKVAILRTLVGLMTVLWLMEWGIQGGRFPVGFLFRGGGIRLQPGVWSRELQGWLRERPTRWLVLAVWFYLLSTLIGTALSASFRVSLWGEIPGQDGYAAYTIVAYVLLFGVITTHLKSRSQLWRLLGAITIMGVLVSGYAVLQAYGHDFLGLIDETGGGTARVSSTTGNAIFAASVMLMPIPVSLVAACLSLSDPVRPDRRIGRILRAWLQDLVVASLWALILTIQLLGITFTFSRGPWLGTLIALIGVASLAALFVGWSALGRTILLLGVSAALTLAVVQFDVPISTPGLWLGAILAMAVILALARAWGWRPVGRASLALGLAATLAAAVLLMPSWFRGFTDITGLEAERAPSSVQARFSSISSRTLLRAQIAGRSETWVGSWRLMRNHPWFEFDQLSLPWLRPLIGYGPDLFRYTYLLESPPQGAAFRPLEADHAHNYLIHQAVELGILGFLSSFFLFLVPLMVGGYQLLWKRQSYSTTHKLLLVGILATFIGRFVEQMVGLARVSDLTVFWVLLAVFATLPQTMGTLTAPSEAQLRPRGGRQSRPQGSLSRPTVQSYDWRLFWRLAIAAWLIGGIAMVTWQKGLNYPRAAVSVGTAVEHFDRGDLQAAIASLDRAIELAPDVPVYYNYRGQVYIAYQVAKKVPQERQCALQKDLEYEVCLVDRAMQDYLEATQQRPFYHRSRLALGNLAFALQMDEEAIRYYRETVDLVPGSGQLRLLSAQAYLEGGHPQAALQVLEEFLAIAEDAERWPIFQFHRGVANRDLGELERSALLLEQSIELGLRGDERVRAHQILAEVYTTLGQPDLASEHVKEFIVIN